MHNKSSAAKSTPAAHGHVPASVEGGERRVGFVGTGYISEWHAKALAAVPGVRLAAVADLQLDRARAFAARFGVPGAHGSLEAMLAAESLDCVHVLLPPDAHHAAARIALEAGVDVFLEKPMCARAEECADLARLAEERGLRLGVAHNFLFSEPFERLRQDVQAGVLGPLDRLAVTWHRELPQSIYGPFDVWMLREPGNIMLEIGAHVLSYVVDLVGPPSDLRTRAESPITLPTGRTFYRRWRVSGSAGRTAVDLSFSFVPGFGEHTVHARGLLGAASADLDANVYALRRHRPIDDDLDRYAMTAGEARELRRQARRTLGGWVLAKVRKGTRGNPYAVSIGRALDAFYGAPRGGIDRRLDPGAAGVVIRVCEEIARAAPPEARVVASAPTPLPASPASPAPKVLVLGATGFIGRELVRQLSAAGRPPRILARSPSKLAPELREGGVEVVRGDLASEADLRRAMQGIDTVVHLARPNVKTWDEYQRHEIAATAAVAEAALAAGVRRFVYTGTIDSYYAGVHAGRITEDTPLDPRIHRRNLYARAKAASEELLVRLRKERALPLVIVRPGIVVGTGGSPFHWGVGMWWHGSVCQIWGPGTNKLPLVLVEDVARGLVATIDTPGIEGESFNLVADPCLSAREYLDELDRCGGFRIQRRPVPIARFYAWDMFKWLVKVAVRFPERRLPSYHDWESRTQRAVFDNARAKERLGWAPLSDRTELVRRGIEVPVRELLA